jgi:Na+/H+ antiporter NhaD/arsenite permease-like protein
MKRVFPTASLLVAGSLFVSGVAHAAQNQNVAGIPYEFIFFALTLLGVALFHNRTFTVAFTGLLSILLYKLTVTGFKTGTGVSGLTAHFAHEWVVLANLFALLMGFAILARHFEKSHVPVILPKYLPDDWRGGFVMLVMVFVISSFLDNIAAAMIGGAMAHQLFRAKVHIGYLAAIVAASNAGGSFSVVGDTTTTMMWIAGVRPGQVITALAAAVVALVISGVIAARQQHAYSPILKSAHPHTHVDWARIFVVALILVSAMTVNLVVNTYYAAISDTFPFVGVAVWSAILICIPVRRHDWEVLGQSLKGTLFLLSLVSCASMMPVDNLPAASWQNTFGLGFISAVFDNIPLTALAISQNGYDWGFLAFAVGYGGSMVWFGSSAGVALSNIYPEAKSVFDWLRHGWHVAVAYVAGIAVMALVIGWHPEPITKSVNMNDTKTEIRPLVNERGRSDSTFIPPQKWPDQ